MIYLNPIKWQGNLMPPSIKDVRWAAFGLLFSFVLLGLTVLGFARTPIQIGLLLAFGAGLDILFQGLFFGKWKFPLSALISCSSLAILINYSHGYYYLWIPAFICIASKYLITFKGKHFFNPSLLAICICVWLGNEFITLSPSYQWYGSVKTAWMMGIFIITGALLLFVFKINRLWLIVSFLITFIVQTALRAYLMKNVIPVETLFIGAITSPAFYLFTFFMITDPATSPNSKKEQIWVGIAIGLFDLIYHTKFSLYTFFYAGITVAFFRFLYAHIKNIKEHGMQPIMLSIKSKIPHYAVMLLLALPFVYSFAQKNKSPIVIDNNFYFNQIPTSQSGLGWAKSDVLSLVDPKLAHVAKWILSVGDAAAVADIDLDGLPDVFLTQTLKAKEWQAKLFLNQGGFKFKKFAIPELEKYLDDKKQFGLPAFAFFLDYDNDGDKDLFVGFGFGSSHLFENRIIPDNVLSFTENKVPFLVNNNSVCLSANALDFNNDGYLDILMGNTLPPYYPDYLDKKVPLNIFSLPKPAYDNDRRMFHFMHESWHNANNGGENFLLLNEPKNKSFSVADNNILKFKETRWSLAIGTLDINNDGYTDIYIANDFGRDDCYLNKNGKSFERQAGKFYGDLGLDTYKGMNTSIGDIDRNGKEDIYVSNVHHAMQAEGSLLWMNQTPDKSDKAVFDEKAWQKNLLNPNRFGWGAAFADLNLDGWIDVIQSNGMVGDDWDKIYPKRKDFWYLQAQIARTGPEIHSYADKWADIRGCSIYEDEADCIFLNNKGESFVDVASQVGFTNKNNTRGVAAADFDNDGDIDLLVTDQFGSTQLFENKIQNRLWLGLQLIGNGKQTSTDAVGSKVWLEYTDNGIKNTQYKEVRLVNGFMAMGDTRLLFGLGNKHHNIENISIKIKWHNGDEQTIYPNSLNQYLKINQTTKGNNRI